MAAFCGSLRFTDTTPLRCHKSLRIFASVRLASVWLHSRPSQVVHHNGGPLGSKLTHDHFWKGILVTLDGCRAAESAFSLQHGSAIYWVPWV